MHQPSDLPARSEVGIITFLASAAWWAAEAAAAAMALTTKQILACERLVSRDARTVGGRFAGMATSLSGS
jgi:hypothetical protein